MRRGRSSRLAGFGHSVPGRCVENAEIEERMGLEPGWIERRTGISSRYWASPDDTLSVLAARAGEAAIENARVARADIAPTLPATQTGIKGIPVRFHAA